MYELSEEQKDAIVKRSAQWLYDYCRKDGLHALVVGISGGLDSAVTVALAKKAGEVAASEGYQLTPVGLILPCHTDPKATELGELVVNTFKIKQAVLDLSGWCEEFATAELRTLHHQVMAIAREKGLYDSFKWQRDALIDSGNRKARMRMMQLYTVAKMLGGIVVSTSNLSEEWMGFWTLHGDVGDIGPIMAIMKGLELYDLARYLDVPQEIITAKPDDGLGIAAGGDAAQIGAPYHVVDLIMVTLIQHGFKINGPKSQLKNLPDVPGVDPDLVWIIATRCLDNAFKRKANPIPYFKREKMGLLPIKKLKLI